MPFSQQLIQFLSEPPGSIVYHLVTLLALQATLGVAWWQARHRRGDALARRLAWAAGLILLSRVALVVAVLLTNDDRQTAAMLLPPLEQALNAGSAILLVWALSPHLARLPRLGDVIVVLMLLFTAVMYAFFATDWSNRVLEGLAFGGYVQSDQVTVWLIFQVVLLSAGLLLLLIGRPADWAIRFFLLLVLWLAHMAHLTGYPAAAPTDTDTTYWIRLGYLIALPLLAAVAYRHTLGQLIVGQSAFRSPAEQLANSLDLSGQVIDNLDIQRTLHAAANLVAGVVSAEFIALAIPTLDNVEHLRLVSARTAGQPDSGARQNWRLKSGDWPAFRMAMQQRQSIELLANGLGARQLHDLYQEMGLEPLGSLLVEPLLHHNSELGVLLLAGPRDRERWPTAERLLTPYLAAFIARAVANAHRHEQTLREKSPLPSLSLLTSAAAGDRAAELERQLSEARAEALELNKRLEHTEQEVVTQQQRARDLAAVVAEIEPGDEAERALALEAEMAALRESLLEAEEAMALASAGEGGLSTEWVMLAITRYSGELEEAQGRIQQLEAQLAEAAAASHELLPSLAEELRSPLASISGYTDLLLGETMGILGARQIALLTRIKANVEQLAALLEQIVLVTAGERAVTAVATDAREAIESAVSAILPDLRDKQLLVELNIEDNLPVVPTRRDALYQIAMHLIGRASLVSPPLSHVLIQARLESTVEPGQDGEDNRGFFRLAVSDCGQGLSLEQRLRILAANQPGRNGQALEGLDERSQPLARAGALVTAHGGRMWIESQSGPGTTVSVLLPLSESESEPA